MKIRPVGAELLHADRPMDTTKLTVAFHNFANKPQNTHITRRGVSHFPKICYVHRVRTLSQESLRSLPHSLHCYHRKQNVRKYVWWLPMV